MPLQDSLLSMMMEEYFDLQDALDELERRKERLRAGIASALRDGTLVRASNPRGTARLDRYHSFTGVRPAQIVGFLAEKDWLDETLQVKGRVLHRMAAAHGEALVTLREVAREEVHESLVVRRTRP